MELWLLWRPVFAGACSYTEMFIHQLFSFTDIVRMHEMLDLKAYDEAAGQADVEARRD